MMIHRLEMRDGHLWCVWCARRWKECPCPGTGSLTVEITPKVFESAQPLENAFEEVLRGAISEDQTPP